VERGGYGGGQRRSRGRVVIRMLLQPPGLEDRLDQLLHEQRNPIGARDNLTRDVARQGFALGHVLDHDLDVLTGEALERDGDHVGAWSPRPLELGATRRQEHEPRRGRLVYQQAQELQGGVVHPVQILRDHEDGAALRQFEKERQDGLQRSLLLPLRREQDRRVTAFGEGEGQERGEERHGFRHGLLAGP
jgi:hypothetical protein